MKRQVCLAVLLHGGRFSWKYPAAKAEGDHDIEMYKALAQTAERGRFDIIFMADGYSTKDDGLAPDALRSMSTLVHFDPLSLLAVLSTVTTRIGLVCTGSTTYNEPYDLARRLATLDHMSGGRIGWNVITSQMTSEALNFGYDGPLSTEARYARAREFLDVCLGLWDSWEDDAFPRDKASGTYADPAKMHVLNHKGRFFKVRGPLNVARMPQGYPVICQAGESEEGREFAAQSADMMYGKATSLAHGQAFYGPMKARLAKYGRSPDSLKIMPGLCCVVGRTLQEARDKFDAVQATISTVEARAFAVQFMGPEFDLDMDPTQPMPDLPPLTAIAARKRIGIDRDGRRLSLVELGRWIAACMGHLTLIGTPASIVDEMERYIDEGGSDGFALMPHYLPGNLDDFVALVVPELQRRGRLRTDYTGTTLRDTLGLPRPPNRHAAGAGAHAAE
ncbi:LLM class flavin-dependent oxidoreductase [Lichenicoccus sp.]|uniref:LLM class flavin-dependent oxidoreductase n=1 Tax=Lichenicoccus sp. TaxID=2781899 RepID=UPI003D119A96